MTGRLTRPLVGLLVGLCLLLTGCVDVPTSGPASRVDADSPPCQNCVNVQVAPPAAGDDPKQVVDGYLRATSNYQPNYAVAKQFLTRAASQTWSPEDGAQIYTGSTVASGKDKVLLVGQVVGALGRDRSYSTRNDAYSWNFGVVKEDGEWRISRPPAGLLVAQYVFARFYTSYNLYFVSNGSTLVPDPIYLPNLPNQANVASVLMKALLAGPTTWLAPAVTNAIPPDTDLSVDAVTVSDGVAEVPLSDDVLTLNDSQRSLLAAQVVYTLSQAAGIDAVRFQVNSTPFRVPESEEGTLEVSTERVSADIGTPVPFVVGDQLYAVRGKTVELVDAGVASPTPEPMPGQLGQGRLTVDSLAVSGTNTDIAVVTDGRTALRSGAAASGNPTVRLSGVRQLLRPQYNRYGELWVVGQDAAGRQRMWVFNGDKPVEVSGPVLSGGRVTAFRISPDGTRMALVRTSGGRAVLGVARIVRTDKLTVDGWRPLQVTQADGKRLTRFADVGWLNATDLLLLGAATPTASVLPFRVSEDGSQVKAPTDTNTWDAVELSVQLGPQTSVIIGRDGRTYKDDGAQWVPFLTGCRTMTFPG